LYLYFAADPGGVIERATKARVPLRRDINRNVSEVGSTSTAHGVANLVRQQAEKTFSVGRKTLQVVIISWQLDHFLGCFSKGGKKKNPHVSPF
jgi:hypothetical protein